jgi:hypothetical protein
MRGVFPGRTLSSPKALSLNDIHLWVNWVGVVQTGMTLKECLGVSAKQTLLHWLRRDKRSNDRSRSKNPNRSGAIMAVSPVPFLINRINPLVAVLKKDRLTTIPTLRNGMRKASNHRSRQSCHGEN